MDSPVNIIRFDIKGGNGQFFNYIPIIKNGATKVNVNFIVYIAPDSIKEMINNPSNQVSFNALFGETPVESKAIEIPVRELSDEDFLKFDFSFLLRNAKGDATLTHLDIALKYSDGQNDKTVFTTSIPTKEVKVI